MASQGLSNAANQYQDALQSMNNDYEYQMAKLRAMQMMQGQSVMPTKPKEKSMFKEVVGDVKGFVLEHRSIIYFIVAALMVDHFFFKGAFKARLQGMADKVVTKVEEKIK